MQAEMERGSLPNSSSQDTAINAPGLPEGAQHSGQPGNLSPGKGSGKKGGNTLTSSPSYLKRKPSLTVLQKLAVSRLGG